MKRESTPDTVFRKHAALLALAIVLAASAGAQAQDRNGAPVGTGQGSIEELERDYWICDHAASTAFLDAGTAAGCSLISETLKRRKFNDDFAAMLAWWRANKAARHAALAAPSHARTGL